MRTKNRKVVCTRTYHGLQKRGFSTEQVSLVLLDGRRLSLLPLSLADSHASRSKSGTDVVAVGDEDAV